MTSTNKLKPDTVVSRVGLVACIYYTALKNKQKRYRQLFMRFTSYMTKVGNIVQLFYEPDIYGDTL